MDDLVERLRARAEFEDARVLKEVMRDGFEPVAYTGSESGRMLREAADALEAAREDAARYRWLRDEARTNRVPHIFQYPAQSFDHPQYPHFKDVGLDAAIDAAREARNG